MTDAPSLTMRRVLVTGADGFLGRGVVAALASEAPRVTSMRVPLAP